MNNIEQILRRGRPGLLVSVRSAGEALAALAGGADVIDVKEPSRGPLGAADHETIADVVRAVNGRAPVTVAAGELVELVSARARKVLRPLPDGVSFVKIGLSHCGSSCDWQAQWRATIGSLRISSNPCHALPVAVVYADWRAAAAPPPERIHSAAVDIDCRVILIDTWDKSAGKLFDHWPPQELKSFVNRLRGDGVTVVLAGSLSGANLLKAAELRPQLVAVRGAACDRGREGTVSQTCVANLRQALALLPDWHEMSSGAATSPASVR
jgi:(5-formylfuran-3-yl)methyl phosphate synthase